MMTSLQPYNISVWPNSAPLLTQSSTLLLNDASFKAPNLSFLTSEFSTSPAKHTSSLYCTTSAWHDDTSLGTLDTSRPSSSYSELDLNDASSSIFDTSRLTSGTFASSTWTYDLTYTSISNSTASIWPDNASFLTLMKPSSSSCKLLLYDVSRSTLDTLHWSSITSVSDLSVLHTFETVIHASASIALCVSIRSTYGSSNMQISKDIAGSFHPNMHPDSYPSELGEDISPTKVKGKYCLKENEVSVTTQLETLLSSVVDDQISLPALASRLTLDTSRWSSNTSTLHLALLYTFETLINASVSTALLVCIRSTYTNHNMLASKDVSGNFHPSMHPDSYPYGSNKYISPTKTRKKYWPKEIEVSAITLPIKNISVNDQISLPALASRSILYTSSLSSRTSASHLALLHTFETLINVSASTALHCRKGSKYGNPNMLTSKVVAENFHPNMHPDSYQSGFSGDISPTKARGGHWPMKSEVSVKTLTKTPLLSVDNKISLPALSTGISQVPYPRMPASGQFDDYIHEVKFEETILEETQQSLSIYKPYQSDSFVYAASTGIVSHLSALLMMFIFPILMVIVVITFFTSLKNTVMTVVTPTSYRSSRRLDR